MSLEKFSRPDASTLESLEGAEILGGISYDMSNETFDLSEGCDRCDCVCNQPCHGEGPCYGL